MEWIMQFFLLMYNIEQMLTTSYFQKVKDLLSNPNTTSFPISIYVESYKDVVKEWIKFKSTQKLTFDDFTIKQAFQFHLTHDNHVLLFHALHFDMCLLMCKIDGIYKFISVPCTGNDIYERNFIATYV